MRVVGGHPALDFANTGDGAPGGRAGVEYLWGYGGLVAWGGHVGLISEDRTRHLLKESGARPDEAAAVHAQALEMRGDLQDVFRAVAEGKDPSPDAMEALRGYGREALARGSLVPVEGGFGWAWPDQDDLAGVLWPVAHAAIGLLTSGRLGRLKLCAGCHWLFLDASKNRSRRWCTMEVCGTDEKMRRYVARRAARRKTT